MAKAEMILKIVMSPTENPSAFADQCKKLLPDLQTPEFQKVLEMKVFFRIQKINFAFSKLFSPRVLFSRY